MRFSQLIVLCLGFLFTTLLAQAGEYTEWKLLTSKQGIEAYVRYRHDKGSSRVQWKIKNTTDKDAWLVSVVEKEYKRDDGSVSQPMGEASGLKAGRENVFGSDTVDGIVIHIQGGLSVKWGP